MGLSFTVIRVSVVYALPDRREQVELEVEPGTTLRDTVERCGILARYPQLKSYSLKLGVFGKSRDPAETAANGDRIEIYRELLIDPKEARRKRALNSKS